MGRTSHSSDTLNSPLRRRPMTGTLANTVLHPPSMLSIVATLVVLTTFMLSSSEAFQTNAFNTRIASRWEISQPSTFLSQQKEQQQRVGLRLLREPQIEGEDGIPRMLLESTRNSGKTPETTDIATALEIATDKETRIYQRAILRTLAWVGAASLFGVFLLVWFGPETSEEFFAGYLVEQSLSVDNLFVFLLLFEYFKVPLESQDRVLNWGIFGAIVMRATMIGLGAAALQNFHEILLVFAGILVYSSAKVLLAVEDDDEEDPSENTIVKFSQNLLPSTQDFDGDRFFTLVDGVKMATPLFICMIAVEISDVVFAIDSIPAVFGVTENPLVVFSSNMFAIMGLRSLYTILSKAASDLKYLEPAVAIVLGFIGFKMIAEYFGYSIPTETALFAVAGLLSTGVGLSVWEKNIEAAEKDLL